MSSLDDDLPRTSAALQTGITKGLHIGAQGYISVAGNVIGDFAIVESRASVAMTTDTLMPWMSSTKPIVAVCIAQLWERGRLKIDDRVAEHIPEFGKHGKDVITIRHLLTHTAGIRGALGAWNIEPWEVTIAKICDARIEPSWIVGQKAGYHVASSWYILGELIRRLDGRHLEKYVRDEIFLPLGMNDCWIGLPVEEFTTYGNRIAILQNSSGPMPQPMGLDTPEMAAICRPGGSGRGPVQQLGRFYEMLLNGGAIGSVRIISQQTVEAMTARQRVGMFDHTFKHTIDWGLGFIVNSNQYGVDTVPYGYGPHASWRTFGHSGYQSSVAFADPKNRLAAAFVFNGAPGEVKHEARVRAVLTGLYEDSILHAGF